MVSLKTSTKSDLTEDEKFDLESGFTLDCVAVGNYAKDGQNCNPKREPGIPDYDSRKDMNTKRYFKSPVVKKLMEEQNQEQSNPIGKMHEYLDSRNKIGAGHSSAEWRGHDIYHENRKPFNGYNGANGCRRNTPGLRKQQDLLGSKMSI